MGSGSDAEKVTFLQQVVPWLESKDWCAGFAAFGVDDNDPFVSNGQLTTLGKAYTAA